MNGHYQFCSSRDLFQFTFRKNTATSGAFTPRHGTVIPITEEEYQRLILLPDDATGIEKVKGGKSKKGKIDIYDLQGRKWQAPQTGVIIQDGKKYAIR